MIKVKPQAKKAKVETRDPKQTPIVAKTGNGSQEKELGRSTTVAEESSDPSRSLALSGLVSYSDESD